MLPYIPAPWILWDLVICYSSRTGSHGLLIDDLPIKHGDFPVRYVKLPEGNHGDVEQLA